MITMMGSMGTYMKNLKLQTQFQIKQSNGELGTHKSLEDYLKTSLNKDEDGLPKQDEKLGKIQNKVMAGTKLTAEERRYLEAHDPETYQKLKNAEQQQKDFEQKLKQCRTKEEAQRLKMTYINSSLVIVKSVEHNSAIPKTKKLEIFMQEKMKCDKIEESAREFVKRGDYERLPTEAEEAKARKDAAEAEKAAQPEAPERKEPADTSEEHEEKKAQAQKEKKPSIHVESREEKKVKRARANARRGSRAEFAQAVAAYKANSEEKINAEPKVDAKG